MSTIVSSDQSDVFLLLFRQVIYCVTDMAESQATRKPTKPKKSISSAAKRPQKTQKFLDDIKQALDDFDDEVFSFASEQ